MQRLPSFSIDKDPEFLILLQHFEIGSKLLTTRIKNFDTTHHLSMFGYARKEKVDVNKFFNDQTSSRLFIFPFFSLFYLYYSNSSSPFSYHSSPSSHPSTLSSLNSCPPFRYMDSRPHICPSDVCHSNGPVDNQPC